MQRYTLTSNRLIEIFSGRSKVAPGETFAMEFVPGQGTIFSSTACNRAPQPEMTSTLA